MVALYSIIIILQLVRWWTWGDTDGSSVVAASTLSHTNPLAPLVPYCPLVPQCCCQRSQCVHTSRAVPPHTRSVFPSPAEQHMITHTHSVSASLSPHRATVWRGWGLSTRWCRLQPLLQLRTTTLNHKCHSMLTTPPINYFRFSDYW